MSNTQEQLQSAFLLAAQRLTVREYSATEMVRYLTRKKFPREIAEEAVQELIRRKWLDNDRFSRAMARSLVSQSKGPGFIRAKLMQKGVSLDFQKAQNLFTEASDQTELEMARQWVEKKYPRAHEDPKQRQRAYAALIRRGFSPQTAQNALKVTETEL